MMENTTWDDPKSWTGLVSPKTATALEPQGDGFVADDGATYPIRDGIPDLLDSRLVDDALAAEIQKFGQIPLENVCYFRPSLFRRVMDLVGRYLSQADLPRTCVEFGGGEGYFASAFLDNFDGGTSYVCDVSMRHLKNADRRLRRVRCDMRRPFLRPGSVGVAAFWVSLHHLDGQDLQAALLVAAEVLAPGGLLLMFEPNQDYPLRRLFFRSRFSRRFYFGDEEKGISFSAISPAAMDVGLHPCFASAFNPPYSIQFLRHFHFWPFLFLATEIFYWLGQLDPRRRMIWKRPPSDGAPRSLDNRSGIYFLALFRRR